MFNYIISRFRKTSKGFDPIKKAYAKKYFEETYGTKNRLDTTLISLLKQYKTLTNIEIVDLGGGPGQYSLLLAKEGAKVHYHDISHNFIKLAVEKAEKEGYSFTYTIDYIDHVKGPYDVIFNRGAFNYCFDDKKFVKILYKELNPEGIYFGILVNENQSFTKENTPLFNKQTLLNIQFWLNDKLNIKRAYMFIHITDFLKDKPYRSKHNKFKEIYFRPLYNASHLVKFINKNHKPFASNKKLNSEISQFTKDKILTFLQKAKNVSFIYRDDDISEELDFIKEKIQVVNHKRTPYNYGFDQHWNDNGRVNIAEHIIHNLAIQACQNF